MVKRIDKIAKTLQGATTWLWAVAVLAIVGVIIFLILTVRSCESPSVEVDKSIGITPTQIRQIEAMGQIEFLGVADEVMIDTVKSSLFSKSMLSKIYRGNLRLGIDLGKAKAGWIMNVGKDSLHVVLPKVELLDKNFIDEAATTTFFEKGEWTAADREALYQRARATMIRRNCTSQNMEQTRKNAKIAMLQILNAMGFEHVGIEFEK